jgi:signal transduction histidine kinase
MTGSLEYVTLDVHPSVVFKLGDDLISDEVQALVELVKNSYDADASYARVTVDTTAENAATTYRTANNAPLETIEGSGEAAASELLVADMPSTEQLIGALTVEDNGFGMTPEIIKDGWLVISNSYKRAMKRSGRKTAKKRTPLGDKGLGRLGAQRLGRELEIVTRPTGSAVQYRVRIPWQVFLTASRLGQVSFPMIVEPPTMKKGTRLTVYGLSDIGLWDDRRDDLTRALSTLVSPFPNHTDLDLTVRIDGLDIDLPHITDSMRESAEVRYAIDYVPMKMSVRGRADIEYWRPAPDRPPNEHRDFARLVEKDSGKRFFDWYVDGNNRWAETWQLKRNTIGGRTFIECETHANLADIDGAAYVDGVVADPGPFTAEVDAFSLDSGTQSVFDSVATYRNYFKAIAGIRVYRNGFGIRMPEDWLGLGKRWSSGLSYYNLKPSNVLGFVDLSAEYNSQLEEMTDREGLRSSPYLTNFLLLMEQWRAFTEAVQTRLRRGYNDYRREMTARDGGMEPESAKTPEDVATELQNRARARQKEGREQNTTIRTANDTLAVLTEAAHGLAERDMNSLSIEGRQRVSQVESGLRQVRKAVSDLADTQARHDVSAAQESELLTALQQQLELVREQLAMSYEAVALGLTAEALSHEVHQIADRLASRTTQVRRTLKSDNTLTPTLSAYLEYVRSQATTLNRQMSHLNPALRFARERRSQISILPFLSDVADYFNQRWRAADSDRRLVAIIDPASRDFTVTMNAGRLTQVVDNLVLNSEYWLRAQTRKDQTLAHRRKSSYVTDDLPLPVDGDGQVILACTPRQITVSDNGPGVAPPVEQTLLDPFVTAKRNGRGLGLYISQQLLEAEGGRLSLDDRRNPHGCRYSFTIDLERVPM